MSRSHERAPARVRPTVPLALLATLALAGMLLAGCDGPEERALAAGNEAFAQGDYASAEAWYRSAAEEAPDAAAPWINTGLSRLRDERYEEALDAYRRGAEKARGPLAARAFFDLGGAALRAGDVETAVEAFREALRLDPFDEDARHDLELAMALQSREGQGQPSSESEEGQEGEQDQQGEESEDGQQGQQDQEGEEGERSEASSAGPRDPSDEEGEEGDEEAEAGEQGEETPEEGEEPRAGGEPQEESGETGEAGAAGEAADELSEEELAALEEALEGMTEEQARRLLRALGGDSRSLQQVLQMRLPATGARSGRDW